MFITSNLICKTFFENLLYKNHNYVAHCAFVETSGGQRSRRAVAPSDDDYCAFVPTPSTQQFTVFYSHGTSYEKEQVHKYAHCAKTNALRDMAYNTDDHGLWDVTPCRLLHGIHFGGTCCLTFRA